MLASREKLACALATVVALGALSAATALGQDPAANRQTVSVGLGTTEPGVPAGSELAIEWQNPDDPNAKPYAVETIVIRFPTGTVIDTSVPEQCKASDAELMASGASACPKDSVVGRGKVVTDSGSPGVPPRLTENTLTQFNNDGELIGLAESQDPPTRVVTRSKLEGTLLTIPVPFLPGGPPDNALAFKTLMTSGAPYVRNGRAYARTPSSCPASGAWTGTIDFLYRDGVSQRVPTSVPCRPGAVVDVKPPVIRVRGVPRKYCTRRGFRVRARAVDSSPLRRLAVYLDGRQVHAGRRARVDQLIRAGRLRPGRHRVSVTARDLVGNLARSTRIFRRCGDS